MTFGSVVPASTMSGCTRGHLLDRLLPVGHSHDLNLFAGKRQRDHPLDRDVVVREQERAHAPGYLRMSARNGSVREHSHTRARAFAVMKSMMCCIGVPGMKMPLMPIAFSFGDVDVGNDAANHDLHVVEALFLEQLHDARADVHVRARQDRQADHVGVFLQRRGRQSARASGAGRCR